MFFSRTPSLEAISTTRSPFPANFRSTSSASFAKCALMVLEVDEK